MEADDLARARPGVLFECHPEVSFAVMNGGMAMQQPKKVSRRKSASGVDQDGIAERRALLARHGYPGAFLMERPGRAARCGWDDLIDACVAAWTAERLRRGQALRMPEAPDLDPSASTWRSGHEGMIYATHALSGPPAVV